MYKVLIVGNPNVGKSTLFNSLTKSSAHTGNFHGVTVEKQSKIITVEGDVYEIVDLPGMYSLNSFTYEEEVAKKQVLKQADVVLFLVDANTIKRNLYLALQLKELGINFKILINNYKYFQKKGNCLNKNILEKKLNINIELIDAKKIKPNKELFNYKKNDKKLNYLDEFCKKQNLNKTDFKVKLEQDYQKDCLTYSIRYDLAKRRYEFLNTIIEESVKYKKDFVYGRSKLDKMLLNPFLMGGGFLLLFFASLYLIFFSIGPILSEFFLKIFDMVIISPITNLLYQVADNVWVLGFFTEGVFSSFVTVLSFLPQICLLFMFLTVLEDSGLISRMAYVFDDFLTPIGLNGKAIYIMLMGLGCNTMSTMLTRNINGKNLKTKTAMINPYITCMARLPVLVLIASAFFGGKAYFVVAGLYLLSFILALVVALILNRILPTKSSELLLEFPPLKTIDVKHLVKTTKVNACDFSKRVFGVVLCVGVIIWILTHTKFNLRYTGNINESILFLLSSKISFLFAPIGLNSAGIATGLVVGLLAKELIVSTFSICNNAPNNSSLMGSLLSANSVIHFTIPSAISFLIFSLFYAPCASNLAIIKKETDNFTMWVTLISQFVFSYLISFVVYQALIKGLFFAIVELVIILIIVFSVIFIIKKVQHKKCLTCGKCNKRL